MEGPKGLGRVHVDFEPGKERMNRRCHPRHRDTVQGDGSNIGWPEDATHWRMLPETIAKIGEEPKESPNIKRKPGLVARTRLGIFLVFPWVCVSDPLEYRATLQYGAR